jgi:hypothetical protein
MQQSVALGDGTEALIKLQGHTCGELDGTTVRRALRPSRTRRPRPSEVEGIVTTGSIAGGDKVGTGGGGAISGACRFVLASDGGGGTPSVRRPLNFERSAILLHLVDQSLNEGIRLGV